jgi:hypothetical protein
MSVVIKDKKNLVPFIQDPQNTVSKLSDKVVYNVTNQSISGDDSLLKVTLTGADQKTLEDSAVYNCLRG